MQRESFTDDHIPTPLISYLQKRENISPTIPKKPKKIKKKRTKHGEIYESNVENDSHQSLRRSIDSFAGSGAAPLKEDGSGRLPEQVAGVASKGVYSAAPPSGRRQGGKLSFTTIRRQKAHLNTSRLDPKGKPVKIKASQTFANQQLARGPLRLPSERKIKTQEFHSNQGTLKLSPRNVPRTLARLTQDPVSQEGDELVLVPETSSNSLQLGKVTSVPPKFHMKETSLIRPDQVPPSELRFDKLRGEWIANTYPQKHPKTRVQIGFLESMLEEMLTSGAQELAPQGGWERVSELLSLNTEELDIPDARDAIETAHAVGQMEQGIFNICFEELIRQETELCKDRAVILDRLREEYANLFAKMTECIRVVLMVLERQFELRQFLLQKEKDLSSAVSKLSFISQNERNKEDQETIETLASLLESQKKVSSKLVMYQEKRRIFAADKIQNSARQFLARKQMERLRLHNSATIIQARIRGMRAREVFLRLKRRKAQEIQAAKIILALFQYNLEIQLQKKHALEEKQRRAATKIQVIVRMRKSRMILKMKKGLWEADRYNLRALRSYLDEIEERTRDLEEKIFRVAAEEQIEIERATTAKSTASRSGGLDRNDSAIRHTANRLGSRLDRIEDGILMKKQVVQSKSRTSDYSFGDLLKQTPSSGAVSMGGSRSTRGRSTRMLPTLPETAESVPANFRPRTTPAKPLDSIKSQKQANRPHTSSETDAYKKQSTPTFGSPLRMEISDVGRSNEAMDRSTETNILVIDEGGDQGFEEGVSNSGREFDELSEDNELDYSVDSEFHHRLFRGTMRLMRNVVTQTENNIGECWAGGSFSLIDLQQTMEQFDGMVKTAREAALEDSVEAAEAQTPAADASSLATETKEEASVQTYASAGVVTRGFLDSLPCQSLLKYLTEVSKIELRAPKSGVWLDRFLMEIISAMTEDLSQQGTLPSLQSYRDPTFSFKPMLGFFPRSSLLTRAELVIISEAHLGNPVAPHWALAGVQGIEAGGALQRVMARKTGIGVIHDQRILDFVITAVAHAPANAMCRALMKLLEVDRGPGLPFFLHLHRLLAEIAELEKRQQKAAEEKKKTKVQNDMSQKFGTSRLDDLGEEFLLLDYGCIRIDQATRILSELASLDVQPALDQMHSYINSNEIESLEFATSRITGDARKENADVLKQISRRLQAIAQPWPIPDWHTVNIFNPAHEFTKEALYGPEEAKRRTGTEMEDRKYRPFNDTFPTLDGIKACLDNPSSPKLSPPSPSNFTGAPDASKASSMLKGWSPGVGREPSPPFRLRPHTTDIGNPSWQGPAWHKPSFPTFRTSDSSPAVGTKPWSAKSTALRPRTVGASASLLLPPRKRTFRPRSGVEHSRATDKFYWVVHIGEFCEACMEEYQQQVAAWKHAFWATVVFLYTVKKKEGVMGIQDFLSVMMQSGFRYSERELEHLYSNILLDAGTPTMTYNVFYKSTQKLLKQEDGSFNPDYIPYPETPIINEVIKLYKSFASPSHKIK